MLNILRPLWKKLRGSPRSSTALNAEFVTVENAIAAASGTASSALGAATGVGVALNQHLADTTDAHPIDSITGLPGTLLALNNYIVETANTVNGIDLSPYVLYEDYEVGNDIDADSWYTKFTPYFQEANPFLTTIAGISATTGTGALARAILPTFEGLIIGAGGPRLRQSAGIMQVFNAANTALGDLNCANLLASSSVIATSAIQTGPTSAIATIVLRHDLNYVGLNADKRLVWSSSTGSNNFFSGAIGLSLARVDATTAAFYTSATGTTLANLQVSNLAASSITMPDTGVLGSNITIAGVNGGIRFSNFNYVLRSGTGFALSLSCGFVIEGNLQLNQSGRFIQYKSGTNQRAGNATLVSGTVSVTNTTISNNSVILLSRRTAGGTIGNLTYTLSAGASFTINSDSLTDTSIVSYEILEVV